MKTAITAAVLTVLSVSLPVVAATTTRYQFKGQNASASFYQFDECSSKSVDIHAFTSRTKDGPGAPNEQMGIEFHYNKYNNCTGEYSDVYGSSPNAKFTIDNQLNSATVAGTFAVYDYASNTTKTAQVNLTWTGIGLTTKGRNSAVYQTPNSIIRYRSNGEYRDAQVSGSVILDGTNVVDNTSSSGSLYLSTSGSYERLAK